MVFSSIYFLVYFFPIFLGVYFLAKKEYKNMVALLGSLAFYVVGGKLFTVILLASLVIDYYLVKRITATKGEERLFMFWLSIGLNVLMLAYFKYANFFVETVIALVGQGEWVRIALPIGISFFTFQKMSYTIDVHRGTHKELKNFSDYALYIILFPQLIAGPIVRYNEIAAELEDRDHNDTIDYKLIGLFRFTVGLAKKVLIANVLGEAAGQYFLADPSSLSFHQAWLGALLYAFQIYFDFSGYSDMAIGIGKMLGFNFPENFNFPYIAQNITEFWKRWHMTLTRWMRDYLYIPLGGNRVPTGQMYLNLSIVFLISGLWHGASWNFVIWGAFHGGFLILDRLFLAKFTDRIGQAPSIVLTFLITLVGWVIFKVENLSEMGSYFGAMVGAGEATAIIEPSLQVWVVLPVAVVWSFGVVYEPLARSVSGLVALQRVTTKQSILIGVSTFLLLSVSLVYVSGSGFNPFIYFRF